MKCLLNGEEMKQCDDYTSAYFKVPSQVLMERAALAVVEEIEERFSKEQEVLVACGTGNNGGDGYAIARILKERHWRVVVFTVKKPKEGQLCYQQMESCQAYGIEIIQDFSLLLDRIKGVSSICDAIFGTGLSRKIEGDYARLIQILNESAAFKIAVDLPSGISTDQGTVLGTAFRADLTVSFAYAKIGHVLYPGRNYTGELLCKEIGITEKSLAPICPQVFCYEKSDFLDLPKRSNEGHKGTFGKVLVIAGSKDMCGAAYFSAKAAYRMGAGLVRIYTVKENRTILQTKLPEAIMTCYDDNWQEEVLKEAILWADVIVAGPGMGTDQVAEKILECLLEQAEVPLILDADALRILAKHKEWLLPEERELALTPHMGEFVALTGKSVSDLKANILHISREFAEKYQLVLAAKDACTVTSLPDGRQFLNPTGNSGMATAGSGDVLCGMVAGLAASRHLSLEAAVPMAVYLHGFAGDLARQELGEDAVMASDLLRMISVISKEI